ncbi:PREDICTED: alpha-ketoglutarate-dependent dioxygenase alkB homolog 6 [Trachymyrmex cornetzi]|uniref:Putative alpha-ketoglutarate-dependent dioxygenase ABH6 n=1 Tax=Trachymyrmex cornetzi TaxID=471704 RepID=A0A195E0V3_9HYME|nr:PREDICTED: alpha-ketoglutarate-dependent dioxygenase alkB homolog 6 [Trachymyrmex cornetzi]KYN18509.1 putative alpha-ketoglutarate-dependent dioxygenase ABH6 [Trachymyrmex cornetzi]
MTEEQSSLLHNAIISEISSTACYIPNFITEEEERQIIKCVNSVPQPKWTQLSHRRLQNWGGIPHPKGMIAEAIPDWLQKYIDKVTALSVFEKGVLPNHVLINEYLSGQGIMAHSDGPLFYPVVTTISCGSHTVLDFYKRLEMTEQQQCKLEFSLLLERRSLLILQKDLYHNYLHSIAERDADSISESSIKNLHMCAKKFTKEEIIKRDTRLSLTIRHVPKTSKLKLKIF